MKYELKNKYDVFTKVKKVIESCETKGQLTVATAMLDNFELYYKGEIVNPEEFYNKSVEEF